MSTEPSPSVSGHQTLSSGEARIQQANDAPPGIPSMSCCFSLKQSLAGCVIVSTEQCPSSVQAASSRPDLLLTQWDGKLVWVQGEGEQDKEGEVENCNLEEKKNPTCFINSLLLVFGSAMHCRKGFVLL